VGITIRDVAAAAGVSTATVSRALRGLPHVDAETRDRVVRVAAELDYVMSPSASRLASGRTGSIAVITPYIARWYFSEVLAGVETVLQSSGTDLLLFTVGDPTDENRIPPQRRLRRRVDGVLVVALPAEDPSIEGLLDMGLPVSLIGSTSPRVPSVAIDDVEAGRTATRHLLDLGHRRIAVIGGRPIPSAFTPEHDRLVGYRAALEEVGLVPDPMSEVFGYFTIVGGEQAMSALLALPEPPSAVFAMSDEMGFGAMLALRSHGLRPGADVSVVGIDGHDMARLAGLTTVEQPVRELGRRAAEALLAQLRTPVPASDGQAATVLSTRLVVRGSTGVPLVTTAIP
jgi:DNA-binding LacI/PurR family transcriptional regulator